MVDVENQVVGVFPGPKFDDAEGADQGAGGCWVCSSKRWIWMGKLPLETNVQHKHIIQ